MGFDIEIARYDVDKCPHCGMPIKGTRIDWTESGGPVWRDFLKEVGYYVPREQRKIEPEHEWYGKDMVLTMKQAKDLAAFARLHDVYGRADICHMVEDAILDESFIAINANW